jgi:hypothetical protein
MAHAILIHNYAIAWFQGNRKSANQLLQASLGILSQLSKTMLRAPLPLCHTKDDYANEDHG